MIDVIIGREYPKKVIPLLQKAEYSIDILVFDWRWYSLEPNASIQKFNNEILIAKKRGVKVRALVNNSIVPTILHLKNLQVKRVGTKTLMHVKFLIIDKKIMVLGSHNLSKNAFTINHEVSLIVDDQTSIKRCLLYFENLCLL